jgi:hypothetical protein
MFCKSLEGSLPGAYVQELFIIFKIRARLFSIFAA